MLHPVRLPVRLSRTFDLLIYSKSRVLSVSHGYFKFSGDMTLDTSIWVASLRSKGKMSRTLETNRRKKRSKRPCKVSQNSIQNCDCMNDDRHTDRQMP